MRCEGRISLRQMSRMLFLEMFGIATLLLPAPLAHWCQNDGVFCILTASGIWALFLWRWKLPAKSRKCNSIEKKQEKGAEMKESEESEGIHKIFWRKGRTLLAIFLFSVGGGFLLYLLVSIVQRQLLDPDYLPVILLTLLFAGGYGVAKGIACRARVYESLFWVLLLPLIAILVIALWNVHPMYLAPFFACGWRSFAMGTLFCLLAFLPAMLWLFAAPVCEVPQQAGAAGAVVVWLVGLSCSAIYLLLLGVFQAALLAELKYPILSLMSVVQMPGNLLERLDAPMMLIWFFCLCALFHSLADHCVQSLQNLCANEGRGRKVVIGMILILISALLLLLHGCGKKDPETHLYPLATGIAYDRDRQEMQVVYSYPVEQSGGGKEKEDQEGIRQQGVKSFYVESLFQAEEQLEEVCDQTVDMNHMKVFVIDRSFLQKEARKEQLLAYFLEHERMAWNACVVFTAEPMEKLFSTGEEPFGLYLKDLLESRRDRKEKAVFTVKDFMGLCKNKTETMLVPVVSLRGEQLVIETYEIVSRGDERGTLTAAESDLAQLLLGKQKTLSLALEPDAYVTLQGIRIRRQLQADEQGNIRQQVLLTGNLKLSAGWLLSGSRKADILAQTEEQLEWQLQELILETGKVRHADLTNSFLSLPWKNRKLWRLYRDNPQAYEKRLQTTIQVRLKRLET